jgi:hypothetical protein
VGDTLLPTGFQYKIINSDLPEEPNQRFLRVDTATANVYLYREYPVPHELLMDSLRSTLGSSFIREWGYSTQCIDVDTATVLGTTTITKMFLATYMFGENYTLAYGLGRIQHIFLNEDPCVPTINSFYRDLVYANINGVEYGSFVTVGQAQGTEPAQFRLKQNYPNPFNPVTTVELSTPDASWVDLKVFDILGQPVATLLSGRLEAGVHKVLWDATGLSSGVYFCRANVGTCVQVKTMVLLE